MKRCWWLHWTRESQTSQRGVILPVHLCPEYPPLMSATPGYMEKVWCLSYSVPWGYGPEVKHLVFVLHDLMNMSAWQHCIRDIQATVQG